MTDFYRISRASAEKVPPAETGRIYRKLRLQTFIAATLGYSLYYVCRTGLNVVKQPVIDSGFLTAAQLGTISSCLLFTYAIGKFVNGFLADYSNIRRFMATGLLVSAAANFLMGRLACGRLLPGLPRLPCSSSWQSCGELTAGPRAWEPRPP